MLTFKRTYEYRPVGPWSFEDYNVFDDGQCVGHVLHDLYGPEGRSWFWSIDVSEQQNIQDRGYAASREQALTDFDARLDTHRMVKVLAV